jgi:hypothetical protein
MIACRSEAGSALRLAIFQHRYESSLYPERSGTSRMGELKGPGYLVGGQIRIAG